jgi:outer membrane protein assembly factor BamB
MINVEDGEEKDKIDVGTYIASSAAINGEFAFYGNYDGGFYCTNLLSKVTIWEYEAGPFLGSPAVAKGKVIIGSQDKNVYCFEQNTGKILWKFKSLRKIDGSPVIADDKVIVGSGDGRIYMLNLESGEKIWYYEIGSPISGTPAILKDKIIIGAEDGRVYCFSSNR